MGRPLLALAVPAVVGSAVGAGLGPGFAWLLLGLAAAAGLLAARGRPLSAWASIAAAVVAVWAAAAAVAGRELEARGLARFVASNPEGMFAASGTAARDARVAEGLAQILLDVETLRGPGAEGALPGRLLVSIGGDAPLPAVLQGDRVSLWTTLRSPRGHATPGARDTVAEARRDGLSALGYCKSARLVAIDPAGRRLLARAREAARERIRRFVPEKSEAGLVRAMLLGDRAGLDRETLERFRAAGTYHVLALSGAQVALVAALLVFGLRRLGLGPALVGPLVSAALFAYAALVGSDPPIVRAAVMASVLLVGRSLELDGDAANLLGLAALTLLLAKPSDVEDPGFQMSFVATLGLLTLTERIRAVLPGWPLGLDLAFAASLAAQLALAPLLVVHFHRLAPAAIVLNLLAVPLATAVLVAGALLAVGSWLVPALGSALGALASTAAHGLLLSGRLLDVLPGLDVRVPDPTPLVLFLHGLALLLLASGRLRLGLAGSVLSVAGLAWGGPVPGADGLFEVTVLDVGQGEALVLRSPGGRHLLVDTGGSFDGRFDIAESVVGPFLWRRRVRELDLLVLTHAHPDHVGGAGGIVRSFRVGEAWEGPAPSADPGYARLDAVLRDRVARRTVTRGAALCWDGVDLEVIGPSVPNAAPRRTRNDDSLVLRIRYGQVVLLLTGDVEAAGEDALPVGPVTALKVAHHGSRTSSSATFLRRTQPLLAVVSAGNRNPFGHPAPEVLGRLQAAGARVYRTDIDGSVRLVTDGCSLRVTSEGSARDENIRPVMDLRGPVDVLRSPACPTLRGGPPLSR